MRIALGLLLLMTGAVLADLNSWNDGTNANVRVRGIVAQSVTNVARTAGTFVVSGADKSDVSTATSAMLAATLTDETGTGKVVFDTSPIFNTSLTLTNGVTGTVGLVVNGPSGGSVDVAQFNGGGTNYVNVTKTGRLAVTTLGSNTDPSVKIAGAGIMTQDANDFSIVIGTTRAFAFRTDGVYFLANSYPLKFGASSDVIFGWDSAAVAQLGADAASPINQTLKACDGSGTDKNGASLTIEGGQGTGTGAGGDLIYMTSIYTNSSASTARAYTTRAYFRAKPTALTDATTNLLFTISLPAGCHVGGFIEATILATDGTEIKTHNSAGVSFSAANKSGTIGGNIAESAQLETHYETVGNAMADTWTIQQSGSTVAILVTPTVGTVLTTPTTYNCKWAITTINSNGPATVTPN